jgi:hypothetical protein
VQHHDAIGRQDFPAPLKKRLVAAIPEMLKCTDTDNPVNRSFKLFPSLRAEFNVIRLTGFHG